MKKIKNKNHPFFNNKFPSEIRALVMVRPTRKKAGAALMETGEIPPFCSFSGVASQFADWWVPARGQWGAVAAVSTPVHIPIGQADPETWSLMISISETVYCKPPSSPFHPQTSF